MSREEEVAQHGINLGRTQTLSQVYRGLTALMRSGATRQDPDGRAWVKMQDVIDMLEGL